MNAHDQLWTSESLEPQKSTDKPGFLQSGFSQGMNMDPNISQPESNENKKRQEEQEEQMRGDLAARLDIPARERLSRIALVSPERSRQIEVILMRIMRTLPGRVTEQQLIDILEKMEDAEGKTRETNIVYHRRKGMDDFDI